MIPNTIVKYLRDHHIPFARRWHTRAVSAQALAHKLHVTGHRVAKAVVVEADEKIWLAVLPASELLDEQAFAKAVGATDARLVAEARFASLFPDCEVGAEPPFGGLYRLGVVVDERLTGNPLLVFRAGSHEETMEMLGDDFFALERPIVAVIGRKLTQFSQARAEPASTGFA